MHRRAKVSAVTSPFCGNIATRAAARDRNGPDPEAELGSGAVDVIGQGLPEEILEVPGEDGGGCDTNILRPWVVQAERCQQRLLGAGALDEPGVVAVQPQIVQQAIVLER